MRTTRSQACPYCKNPLNPGAIACSACSARETTKWDAIGQMRRGQMAIICGFGVPLGLLALPFSPVLGLLVMAGAPVAYFQIRSRLQRHSEWVAGGRALM